MLDDHSRSYRNLFADSWPQALTCQSAKEIEPTANAVELHRTMKSHRGIGEHRHIRALLAGAVDQDFLKEIGNLTNLEHLEMAWPTTAKDLSPIDCLRELRVLKIDSPRNIADFSVVTRLPKLECLFIENAKHMAGLEWISPLRGQLKVLGIEGSMYTKQKILNLVPLQGFALEALFLTSTQLGDQSLRPLHRMRTLRYLGTALNAPKREFDALQAALPELHCSWFDPESWKPFRDPRPPKNP